MGHTTIYGVPGSPVDIGALGTVRVQENLSQCPRADTEGLGLGTLLCRVLAQDCVEGCLPDRHPAPHLWDGISGGGLYSRFSSGTFHAGTLSFMP